MRWQRGHESRDVVDQRGQSSGGGGGAVGAGMLGLVLRLVGTRFGFVGIAVVLGLYFGAQFLLPSTGSTGAENTAPAADDSADPSRRMGRTASSAAPGASGTAAVPDESRSFVGFVLDDLQDDWQARFAAEGKSYKRAKLVLFTDRTATGCGTGEATMGPFYCPADQRVFIDLGFFAELERRFGAPGDFARAYVIAHEVGHHVQRLLGLDAQKRAAGGHDEGATGASVRLELQADCLAGVWAYGAGQRKLLEPGDIEEGLAAAAAVGDDRLQKGAGRAVSPESWTHGSSAQRSRWFRRGFQNGDRTVCDTSSGSLD